MLQARTGCDRSDPRRATSELSWRPARERGSQQRVVVTIFADGFASGNFDSSGPLDPSRVSLSWTRLRGQAFHFWQVLTLHRQGWVSSETAMFEGPLCAVDLQR
jgi:hypothetical protein